MTYEGNRNKANPPLFHVEQALFKSHASRFMLHESGDHVSGGRIQEAGTGVSQSHPRPAESTSATFHPVDDSCILKVENGSWFGDHGSRFMTRGGGRNADGSRAVWHCLRDTPRVGGPFLCTMYMYMYVCAGKNLTKIPNAWKTNPHGQRTRLLRAQQTGAKRLSA